MIRLIQLALLKALFITIGSSLIYVLYGLIADNPFKITLKFGLVFFLGSFLISLIEYVWERKKKKCI